MWKQYKGVTLNFISENAAPTSTIAANLMLFKDLTGIEVKISLRPDATCSGLAAQHLDGPQLGPTHGHRYHRRAPMIVVVLAVRRYLVKGLSLGAVTGE